MSASTIIKNVPNILTASYAEYLVETLNDDEQDDWEYKMVVLPGAKAKIEVYDEEKNLLGYL